MKRIRRIYCCLLIIGIVTMSGCHFPRAYFDNIESTASSNSDDSLTVESFSLSDSPYYLEAIEDFPSDKYLGEVLTAEEAIAHAEREWVALYGDKVNRQKPYKVSFDAEMNVWLVRGSLPGPVSIRPGAQIITRGRVAGILIQKEDGKILAVWHD